MKRAFTLVEISVVLLIIGLLVGGVLAGQGMVRNAKISSVVQDFKKFQAATNTFLAQYQALPGDMPNATDFWGEVDANATTCKITQGTGTETCNGDGNGQVSVQPSEREGFRFWQHLANAGLLAGSFSGIEGSNRYDQAIAGTNAPSSRVSQDAVWYTSYMEVWGSSYASDTDYGNFFLLGGETIHWPYGNILTTAETQSIDQKMDDGHASDGAVWAVGYTTCTTGSNGSSHANYDLSADGVNCGIAFLNAY